MVRRDMLTKSQCVSALTVELYIVKRNSQPEDKEPQPSLSGSPRSFHPIRNVVVAGSHRPQQHGNALPTDPSLNTPPDAGHDHSVEDGPVGTEETEGGSGDGGELDVVHSSLR